MEAPDRPWAVPEGPLVPRVRGRDLSGLPIDHLRALSDLVKGVDAPCWATGPTSASLFRMDGFHLRPPFHIVIPRGHHIHRVGHVVHTTIQLDPIDRETVLGIPCVSPTRTLLSIAGMVDAETLTIALDSALRDRLTTDDFLHRRIAALRSRGRFGIPKLLDVMDGAEVVRGGQSWLEREVLRLLAAAGLPRPRTQAYISRRKPRLIRVDFRWEGTPVVLEALGYRWHRTGAQMTADARRMNQLLSDGFLPYQVTYDQVVDAADEVVAIVAGALAPFLPAGAA